MTDPRGIGAYVDTMIKIWGAFALLVLGFIGVIVGAAIGNLICLFVSLAAMVAALILAIYAYGFGQFCDDITTRNDASVHDWYDNVYFQYPINHY
ncbi:hypothetical protein F-S17_0165 [Faustovirus]|nr:hypothetical protein F-LCD7_0180 [Faustovirus]QJX71944.1 hypothetical protein F-M6_0181 [Faustovirus]QJX72431.1 hypothetical protein F-S17_0165 [Faustovirus]QJX72941.1 hypothetical protein F-VV57_0179 [Faustovirus]QJX73446.1 hypothetical protein F-VV63_0180 [Faustovirus]